MSENTEKQAGTTTITFAIDIPPGRKDCALCGGVGIVLTEGVEQISSGEIIAADACPACRQWKIEIAQVLNTTLDALEQLGCTVPGRLGRDIEPEMMEQVEEGEKDAGSTG